jgi:hypothetical protein
VGYNDALKANGALIKSIGEGNAHLIWALGLYLEEPDLEALASEALTDGPDDKKIDFIYLDRDTKRIIFAQGYCGAAKKDSAPANKASDLNTAAAWLMSGNLDDVPKTLRAVIQECRDALKEGEIEGIELLYVHNYPESVNVNKELLTVASQIRKALGEESAISVTTRELGSATIEHLFATQESHIDVKDEIVCPSQVAFSEKGPTWEAAILSVPGIWLNELFGKYGERLFSANYRGFLGITRRRRINTGIRQSAETKPKDFWVFNNGITLLTLGKSQTKDGTRLTGISIINGAQTTGSIGSVDPAKHDLTDVRVLCRVIQSADAATIGDIVKYNNTQNEITTWDQYSNDPEQNRIDSEFSELGHKYSRKRGFKAKGDQLGIEEVAQPLLSFHGRWQDATRGKNQIFDRKPLYNFAFENKKARHILFVYALARAIDERRIELKNKSTGGTIITIEEEQLSLLRSLRFKQFLIAVVSRSLESVLGRKVTADTVAFSPAAASVQTHSIEALVAAWSPVVESVLAFVATKVNAADFSARLGDESLLEDVSKHVSAMLYSVKAINQFGDFAKMVSDS